MQRAWKKSMSQETWARSFDVLHSGGAGRAFHVPPAPLPRGPAQLRAEREAGESTRCFLSGENPVTYGIMNSFVLLKPQSGLVGDKRNITLNLFPIKLEVLHLPLHIFI